MKTLIAVLAVIFAAQTYAADPVVCAPTGPDMRPCKPPAVKVNGRCTIVKEKVVPCPPLPAPVVVTKEVIKEVPVPGPVITKTYPVEVIKYVELESPWEIMAYAQFGAHLTTSGYPSTLPTQTQLNGSFNNWGVWNVGTEFHIKPYRLGLRTAVGNNGISGLVQVFPVQGRLNWYIGAGGGYTQYPFYRPSVPYVQRYFDVQIGTGVEYAFTDHIIGLADLKASVPMPWTDAPNLTWYDVGQSFKQTSILVGVGYRF